MKYLEFLKLALTAIRRNKTRSMLTMLGIIIGVGAVITMIGIGQGSKQASEQLIRSMGTNLITVIPGSIPKGAWGPVGQGAVETLTEEDALALKEELPNSVAFATPYVRTAKPAVYGANNWLVGRVEGANEQYLDIKSWGLDAGRYFNSQEVRSLAKVCVIGKTVEENLFPGGEDPVGKTIRVGTMPFEVIGVLSRKGAGFMGDQDDVIHAPYTTVMKKIMGRDKIQQILVSAISENQVDYAESEITSLIRQRHRLPSNVDNDFSIRKQNDWLAASAQQSAIITTLLAVAASISLIVGGIGIGNIMLVSVTERTREIGIRRALGATRRSVLWQFLIEASVLSSLGGLVGIGLAFSLIALMQALNVQAVIVGWAVILGIGFSSVIGLSAGFLPALKAANLDVIDALRYE